MATKEVKPHKGLRDCYKWCKKADHSHTPIGDAHLSHGKGAFRKKHPNYYKDGKLKPAVRNRLKLYARAYRARKKKGKK